MKDLVTTIFTIDYLNKDANFERTTKHFYSYEDAAKWGKTNLGNFNSDMIRIINNTVPCKN